ncbi:MAG: M48 family metalloprotease [Thermodesulfobacteriota bacterium]
MLQRTKSYWVMLFLTILFLCGGLIRGVRALTVEEEKKLGKRVLLEMERKGALVGDLALQAYMEKLGNSLVAKVGSTPFEFRFLLVNGPEPNAFAVPGGYIFVTTGLIVLAENEEEVAGVLSHEISHVTARHIAQMIERSKRINIASMVAILASMLAGGGGTGGQAGAAMAMATAEALELKYTREMEVDADQNALQYLIKAGYDPHGMITFLNKIYKMSLTSGPQLPSYLSTHPAIENRISLLENLLHSQQRRVEPLRTAGDFKRIQAKAFVEERQPNVAVAHYQSLVDADSQSLEGFYGLGLAYRKMGRLDKATETFQKANALAPQDIGILRELGIVYFQSGKLDLAIETLEAIQAAPDTGAGQNDDLFGLYYLGRAYREKGDFAKALPLFLKIQRKAPEFVEVYLNLGSVHGRMGQKGLSHFYFGKHFLLRGDGKNALLHFRTALEWLEKGSPEREEAQQEIKELAPAK